MLIAADKNKMLQNNDCAYSSTHRKLIKRTKQMIFRCHIFNTKYSKEARITDKFRYEPPKQVISFMYIMDDSQ